MHLDSGATRSVWIEGVKLPPTTLLTGSISTFGDAVPGRLLLLGQDAFAIPGDMRIGSRFADSLLLTQLRLPNP